PHMPRPSAGDLADSSRDGPNKVKRRIQAQLRYLLNGGELAPPGFGLTNTAYALTLDGDFGAYPREATVASQSANLRSSRSTQGTIVGHAAKNDKLALIRQEGEWYQVVPPTGAQMPPGQNECWV